MEIDTSSTHPNPMPDPYHRKIELQSPLDLTYLQTNLSNAAQQKLDLHFPPSALRQKPTVPRQAQPATVISLGGPISVADTAQQSQNRNGNENQNTSHVQAVDPQQPAPQDTNVPEPASEEEEDPLRAHVRNLVDAFLMRTWTSACENITINGLDGSSFYPSTITTTTATNTSSSQPPTSTERIEQEGIDFHYSAYDSRLQSQVAKLYGEVELLTAQVSRLRREAPKRGAEMVVQRLSQRMEEDERLHLQMVRQDEERWKRQRRRQEGGEEEKPEGGLGGGQKVQEERDVDMDRQDGDGNVFQIPELREGWYEDTKSMYERGLEELARLSGMAGPSGDGGGSNRGMSLTETLGKVQRARMVAMELE